MTCQTAPAAEYRIPLKEKDLQIQYSIILKLITALSVNCTYYISTFAYTKAVLKIFLIVMKTLNLSDFSTEARVKIIEIARFKVKTD